jgi:tyrosine phenol-lyase
MPLERRSWAEPFKIKMVEHVRIPTREQRERAIAEAGYNTFLLRSRDVYIDLLTDSGTSAMSDRQWAGMMLGDEAYAGSESYYRMEASVRRHYGYAHVVPTHQGRGAEHIISRVLIREGDVIPGNMYFTTTRLHQEMAGGRFVDVIVDEAHDPASECPFKGDVDLGKLERVFQENPGRVPYVSVAATVNMAGGQPISLANMKAVYELARHYAVKVILDATRIAENAWFIQQREPGQQGRSVGKIVKDLCAASDGCTMSAKKDPLANIGGFLAVNDGEVAEAARNLLVAFEGLHTYGGMSGRDMEAVAIGIEESVQDDHIRARIGQVPQEHYPAQALAAAIYLDSGIRAMERGTVSAGRDAASGEERKPKLELVRLTIPRRVYTQAHMDVTAESVCAVYQERDAIRGLRMTYEPKLLRFFQARFEPR